MGVYKTIEVANARIVALEQDRDKAEAELAQVRAERDECKTKWAESQEWWRKEERRQANRAEAAELAAETLRDLLGKQRQRALKAEREAERLRTALRELTDVADRFTTEADYTVSAAAEEEFVIALERARAALTEPEEGEDD